MHDRSIDIYNEKKAAVARGDEAVKQLFREGKDLMSILRTYYLVRENPVPKEITYPNTVRANMAASATDRLSDEELIGQMS